MSSEEVDTTMEIQKPDSVETQQTDSLGKKQSDSLETQQRDSAETETDDDCNSRVFPEGIRVLVVDDDTACLRAVEQILRSCKYQVTSCEYPEVALSMLRERKGDFDLVLTDVHMPGMDGFKLLEHIGLELDLPVVLMSVDCKVDVAIKGLEHGACFYLMKPLTTNDLKNIWQYAIRKRKSVPRNMGQTGSDKDTQQKKVPEDSEFATSVNEENNRKKHKRKEAEEEDSSGENEGPTGHKNQRVVWHSELHNQFMNAVNHLGFENAMPTKILELMSVPGLTRQNVASHLQKYRVFLRRLNTASQSKPGLASPLITNVPKSSFGPTPPQLLFGLQNQSDFIQFAEHQNLTGILPGLGSNMPVLNPPAPIPPVLNPMNFLNQNPQSNNSSATLRFGQSLLNTRGNMQPTVLQPNAGNSGFGMFPNQNVQTISPSLADMSTGHVGGGIDLMQTIQPNIQTSPGLFGSSQFDSFPMTNPRSQNNFPSMGNVGLVSNIGCIGSASNLGNIGSVPTIGTTPASVERFTQNPPFSFGNNHSGLQLTRSGGLFGSTQTGMIGESSNNNNSSYNLLNESNTKVVIGVEAKNPSLVPDFSLSNLSSGTNGFGPFNGFSNSVTDGVVSLSGVPNSGTNDQFSSFCEIRDTTQFKEVLADMVQQQNDLLDGTEATGLADMMKGTVFETNSTPAQFSEADWDVLNFMEDGLMGDDFDFNTFQVDGIPPPPPPPPAATQ
ncbi:two-component response regulator ARR2-like [Tasmannia lanceolata]|uniref:two-component response regulator ARR2-like n=1 Tax=Tasmannia lanceolata TaxID=3420 RepID=UPI00406346A7